MKEVRLPLQFIILSIEKPLPSINKIQEKKFWLLVSKSSIYWLLIPEEEKSVFLEEPVSEKPCWFKVK